MEDQEKPKPPFCAFSECDVLAIATLIAKQFAECTATSDELGFWGDLISAIGNNITMLAGQRERLETCKNLTPSPN